MGIFDLFGRGSQNKVLLARSTSLEANLLRSIAASYQNLHNQNIHSEFSELEAFFALLIEIFRDARNDAAGMMPVRAADVKGLSAELGKVSGRLKLIMSHLASNKAKLVGIKHSVTVLGRTDNRLRSEFEKNVVHRYVTAPIQLVSNERRLIAQSVGETNRLATLLNQLEQKTAAELNTIGQVKAEIDAALKGISSVKFTAAAAGNSQLFMQAYAAPFAALERAILTFPKLRQVNAERETESANISNLIYSIQSTLTQLSIANR